MVWIIFYSFDKKFCQLIEMPQVECNKVVSNVSTKAFVQTNDFVQ